MQDFPSKICIVDDDNDFANFLAEYLTFKGSSCFVFSTAEGLLEDLKYNVFEFFILDLGLPGIDGVDLISIIRRSSSAGILIISGRLGPDAFNSALNAGADMFINKPARFDQISQCITSVWRRSRDTNESNGAWLISEEFGPLISPAGDEVILSRTEYQIINELRKAGAKAVSRAALSELLGGQDHEKDRSLDAIIFRLRRKIESQAKRKPPFCTVHGVGFRIIENIETKKYR